MQIHRLASGASVISLSPHGFRFNDGTVAEPQDRGVCDRLTLRRQLRAVGEIAGMAVNEVSMPLTSEQVQFLHEVRAQADLVILPFPVLSALREQGIRDQFPNCVAFNATLETQRCAPDAKIVDINNWSY